MISKRLFIFPAFMLLVVACLGRPAAPLPSEAQFNAPIRFAVIGDRTGGHTPGVYRDIILEIERLKPDLTMTVGDMIEGYSDDTSRIRRQWEAYLTLVDPLSAPIYCTPGNHDIWGENSFKLYQAYVGEANYAFDYRGAHFVVLENGRWDSSDKLPQEKIDWLTNDLKKNQAALFTLVFFHKPFWFDTLAHGKPDRLHDIFKTYGVDAVFTGHYHVYFSDVYDGIRYTSLGSSGGRTMTGITGLHYHFGWVTLNKAGVHIALIKNESVLPHDEVTAQDMVAVERIEKETVRFNVPVMVGDDLTIDRQTWAFILKNPNSDMALMDEILWEIPKGWTVEPAVLPVSLAPGEELTVKTTLSSQGSLYPLPEFRLNMPYKPGATYGFSRSVRIERQTMCRRTRTPPRIDGILNEDEIWRYPEKQLFGRKGQKTPTEPVAFHLTHDNKYLYLATVCMESKMDQIQAFATKRDGAVYGDDCVCLLLSAPGQNSDGHSYEICFNPNGVIFDQRIDLAKGRITGTDPAWNADCDVKAMKSSGRWHIEARMPFAALGVKKVTSGDQWRVNFHRKQKRLKTSAAWMVPVDYNPDTYGTMVME